MKSRGRKPDIHPQAEIENLVKRYIEEKQPIGKIKYKEVYLFVKELYISRETDYKLSDDFWRKPDRQGRKIIDSINDIRAAITKTDKNSFEVISTSSVVNEFSKDIPSIKKRIIARLKANEYGYRNLIEKYKKLVQKEDRYKQEIEDWKSKYEEAKFKNTAYEQVLFQWANISSTRDLKLINTITTGKTRSKVVEQLFKEIFSEDPNAAYRNINQNEVNKNNVINLTSKPKNSLVEDLDL